MKKVILIIAIILIGCAPISEEYKKSEYSFYLPLNWQEKTSAYGDYFFDLENIILVLDVSDKFEQNIKSGLNFYRTSEFRLNDKWKYNYFDNEFLIETSGQNYKKIRGKIIDEKIVAITSKEEKTLNEIFKNVFR